MNKYLKEILIYLFSLLIVAISVFLLYNYKINKIKEDNLHFQKNDKITYIQNENRIEYEFSKPIKNKIETVIFLDSDNKKYTAFYPKEIKSKVPIILWINNSNLNINDYEKSLKSLSSYGFIVCVPEDDVKGDGRNLSQIIRNLHKINKYKTLALYNKIDLEKIGLAGHGYGGCEVLNCLNKSNKDIVKSIFITSLPQITTIKNEYSFTNKKDMIYNMKNISQPIFITAGSGNFDSFYSPSEAISEEINSIPAYVEAYGAIRKKYDNNLVNNNHPLGYMNAWFAYTLKKDTTAANAFIINEELQNNPRWAMIKDNRKNK